MHISEFFRIFNLSYPGMEKVRYFVYSNDYTSAKRELLRYFTERKARYLSSAEPLCEKDKNFPLAYIARHGILSGPNEADLYLSSMFISRSDDYTTLDIMPFLKSNLSLMLMSRQKEAEGALFYSPVSMFPPYVSIVDSSGEETKLYCSKHAYVSPKSPSTPLSGEDIYEICEHSENTEDAYSVSTGRVYLGFDLSSIDLKDAVSARLCAKISLGDSITTKELLLFNISDTSWDNSLTWDDIKGNIYSWENSPTGPEWTSPDGSDSEYLNVTCRFWFARPMAYQYLSDIEKNAIYGEKLLFLMDAFSKKKEGGFNRVLETGERLSNFTCVLNALIDTPAMTEDYLISILWIMYRDIKHLCENPDLGWSNWAVVRTSGLSKAIDFLPELKESEKWKTAARDVLGSLFDRMYSPDFSFREAGLAYSFWCTDLFSSAIKSAYINNDPYSAFTRNRIEKAFDASLDLVFPNLYDTNIGDSNYQSKAEYIKTVGEMFPTKKFKALTQNTTDNTIPLSVMYPFSGSVIMRNALAGNDAIYLAMHSNPFDGHAHDDLGSLVLYANNRPLITDMGRYGYSKGEISAHLKTAAAHNSIEIPNLKYSCHSESEAKITRFVTNAMFDYAESVQKPYKEVSSTHTRRVLFVKSEGFVIVSDYITTDTPALCFNQNWHFMPNSNPQRDYNNHIATNFEDGGNIQLVCPDADVTDIRDDIFSSGYGMAEKSDCATFTKYGQSAAFTTFLLPFKGEKPHVSAFSITPVDLSVSGAVFDIGSNKCVFCAKNTAPAPFLDSQFDGDMAFLLNGRMFLSGGTTFMVNSTPVVESPVPFKDIYIHISSGIVEIVSSSLEKCTKREEAIKIHAPKTTHVILNGENIPFTLYSDYVYAVKPQ